MLIHSLNNPKVVELSKLSQKKFRKETHSYIVIGENAIKEARLNEMILLEISTDSSHRSNYDVLLVTADVMAKIITMKPIPTLIAQVRINQEAELENRVIALDEIQDPGNMGTILRTAHAFGIQDVFLGDGCIDIYNEKVISAMQGAQFHMNFKTGNLYNYLENNETQIITTFLDEENQINSSLSEFILVIGNEGHGIDRSIKLLPHKNKKLEIKFDSLNVAIATGIIIHELV